MVDKNLVTSVLKFTETKDMPISTLSLLNADGEILEGAQEPKIDKYTALKIYRDMNYIRVLDERMIGAQRQGIALYLGVLPWPDKAWHRAQGQHRVVWRQVVKALQIIAQKAQNRVG